MRILACAVAFVVGTARFMIGSGASAQAVAPVAAHYSAAAGTDTPRQARFISGEEPDFGEAARIGLGLVGGFGGAFAGGAIGDRTARGCHDEWCGFGNVLAGAAIGSVVMATLLSAAPSLGSRCTTAGRGIRALGGSVTGALAGGAIGLLGGPLTVLTYVVGSGIGAGVGAAIC